MHRLKITRPLLALLALCVGLVTAISLAQAGQKADWGATELQLQNIDFLARPFTVTFFSPGGVNTKVITDVLAGKRSEFFSPTLPTQFTGTVYLDTPGPMLGVVTHLDDNPPGAAQWPLIDDNHLSRRAYVPNYLTVLANNRLARIKINNLEPLLTSAWITFYNSSGAVLLTRTVQIPPLGAAFLGPLALGLPPSFQASAFIQANRKVYVAVDRSHNTAFASAQAPSRGGYTLVAPLFIAQLGGRDSKFAIQNTALVTTTGVLTYYQASGGILAVQPFTLAPYASFVLSSADVPTGTFGHVVASADQPLAGLVLGEDISSGLWDYTAIIVQPELPDTLDRTTAYGPAVFSQHNGWSSQIFAVNLSANMTPMTMTYSAAPSGVLTVTTRLVQPHALTIFSEPVTDLPPAFEHTAMRLTSGRVVAAVVWSTNNADADGFMAYETQYARGIVEHETYLPTVIK